MLGVVALVVAAMVTPPGPVTIDVVSLSGDGCRPGTATVAMSGDNQAFTVTYSDFVVQAKGAEAKKSCTIAVELSHASGYTYGVERTDFRGFVHLGGGERGTQRSSYRFPGYPTRHGTQVYQGPVSDNWQVTDVSDGVQHGPCKGRKPLTIEAELKVTGKAGMMTMDSTDSSVSSTFRLSWQRCGGE